ncbi:uncharacterized protein TRAVEDRAFT_50710 [Trametes versicolor FP-101664 SS1]|uniref:uncharacterized protein n=1 Tax=Trametes versicolor (strain FP-101664) TaxID=717944 RepID=UPI00046215DD|nr:uncharacterized protein TRAVEDRAFT_50710 [Trametes versicolor FP-101664 SS1]EIW56228.1 hypothetical protein TRAVEDRAFT_50710 [Trametes versicolor FP-101664 SS1]
MSRPSLDVGQDPTQLSSFHKDIDLPDLLLPVLHTRHKVVAGRSPASSSPTTRHAPRSPPRCALARAQYCLRAHAAARVRRALLAPVPPSSLISESSAQTFAGFRPASSSAAISPPDRTLSFPDPWPALSHTHAPTTTDSRRAVYPQFPHKAPRVPVYLARLPSLAHNPERVPEA